MSVSSSVPLITNLTATGTASEPAYAGYPDVSYCVEADNDVMS